MAQEDAGVYHGSVAQIWDSIQGELGDSYRRDVIHPFVAALIDALEVRSVLDLGSGNGCTLRWLEQAGVNQRLVGVEASADLVELAERRWGAAGRSSYICGDMSSLTVLRRAALMCGGGNSTLALSLFGVQDCADLRAFLASLRVVLNASDALLLVFEDPAAMLMGEHKFARRSGAHVTRDGRLVQFVEWLPGGETPELGADGRGQRVVTHLRSIEEYVQVASREGFELTDWPVPHPESTKFNFLLMRPSQHFQV